MILGPLVVGLPGGVILAADGGGARGRVNVLAAAAATSRVRRAGPGAVQDARSGAARGQQPWARRQRQYAQRGAAVLSCPVRYTAAVRSPFEISAHFRWPGIFYFQC